MRKVCEIINNARTVAIGGHQRPDGDCVGVLTALKGYLNRNYPDIIVDCYIDDIPKELRFLTDDDFYKIKVPDKKYDLFISCDCGDLDRLGDYIKIFKNAARTCNIDHHVSNTNFADENIVYPLCSSSCELLLKLADRYKMDDKIATSLYTGIIHDTGVLQYSNTTMYTFKAITALFKYNIDFTQIIEKSFYSKTFIQNKLLGMALTKSELIFNDFCIISVISLKESQSLGASSMDFEGIVSQLRLTSECQIAVLLHENEPGSWRVSMRAKKDIDLVPLALRHHGGGHTQAAGCSMSGNKEEVYKELTDDIKLIYKLG